MSNNFFDNYPTTTYKKPIDQKYSSGIGYSIDVQQVDLYLKFKIKDAVLNNASLFYPYRWKDTDTPWTLARFYYGSEQYHWVIFYSNNAFDLTFDFPMSSDVFTGYLVKKYKEFVIQNSFGGDTSLYNALSFDRKAIETMSYLQSIINSYEIDGQFIVDFETYNQHTGPKRIITQFDFEDELNESKREVQILDNEYLKELRKEFLSNMTEIRSRRILEGE